jgi:hypothetical protein
MNDAEERFAERLAADLEHVLGAGIAIDDVELAVDNSGAHVTATLLVDGRIETVEADGENLLDLYRPLVQRAAELRLGAAFWRMVGPA